MSAPTPLTVAYRTFVKGHPPRPLLGMQVTGINGKSGPVFGLIDSGADSSSLPLGYASLLGYTVATLVDSQLGLPQGERDLERKGRAARLQLHDVFPHHE